VAYNIALSSVDSITENDIIKDLNVQNNGSEWARALISANGYDTQAQFTGNVPEPSTWAMMILGFAGIDLMAYRTKSNRSFGIS